MLGRTSDQSGVSGRLGHHRARDGSTGVAVEIDFEHPHVGVVVGKRGYGKSYTLGVCIEELARSKGVAPVVIDPMGIYSCIEQSETSFQTRVISRPQLNPAVLPASTWPTALGVGPETSVGALLWDAAGATNTLDQMSEYVTSSDAKRATQRAAMNRLERARSWGVFDAESIDIPILFDSALTIFDCHHLDTPAMNAVITGVAHHLYRARVNGYGDRLPWLVIDEAQIAFQGVAKAALHTLLTRGRAPGVSLLMATQRPSALPSVALSQADIRIIHRLTAGTDIETMCTAEPIYLTNTIEQQIPQAVGEALVIDDATEAVRTVCIRPRDTPHDGGSPRASVISTR